MRTAPLAVVLLGSGLLAFTGGCTQAAPPVDTATTPAPATQPPMTSADASGNQPAASQPAVNQPDVIVSMDASATPAEPKAPGGRTPDVIFVPTPRPVVDAMLKAAAVGPDDVLYDLGSGDGRIPITAAQRWGTRGVGIDIDPVRIREANAAAVEAGVTDDVRFVEADLFQADLSEATVISLYLLPSLNMRLRPTLLRLKPGTRIVSHNYHLGDWQPDQTENVGHSTVYSWTVPETLPAHLRAD